jgi:transcriptional regulator with XRE-family HTH domain
MSDVAVIEVELDARRLPALRRRIGLTQAALARKIGCHTQDVSRLERSLMPGELLDRVVGGLLAAVDEHDERSKQE